jgi:type II secretory pathway pseudopilin PulG
MKNATTSIERPKGIRLIEIAIAAAVLGIFVSLAIPALVQMRSRSRVDQLLASARSCCEELPQWLSHKLSSRPVASDVGGQAGAEAPTASDLLEAYARVYNERLQPQNLPGENQLLVVEPSGTLPIYCRRDGRIHIIPFMDPAVNSVGATVVVTDEDGRGGPAYDGILAVFNVAPAAQ